MTSVPVTARVLMMALSNWIGTPGLPRALQRGDSLSKLAALEKEG